MEQPAAPSIRAVFDHALEIQSSPQREAYLAQACGEDPALRGRVDALLRAYADAGSFLEPPEPGRGAGATLDRPAPPAGEGPGSMVGPYKLLQQIGEGGMGVVFLAEQQRPVRRQLAVKVIKAGMDTRQVVARFEAERQALALMDHPNIAKVFDAGVTHAGRPYFVMELVKGVPVTTYCDEHHADPRQRLELFVQVCQAVQHAHTKGIIHRDLKPSNVLVALYDGKPVPKVIDFGVAKATGRQLTDRTMFTGLGDVIGTPQYMSPEQAQVNQLDVDTRSDVYSLGVLLYELLTGTTPIEPRRVREGALLEVLRVIREEEPPRPSTRLATTDRLPSIAACRGLGPAKLSGLVRGELDWIVMRALEKDRGRRYETASGFASDVRNYLDDEPVHACPPSAVYRFGKFARRHKAALLAATAAVATLLLIIVGLAISNRLIAAERNEKSLALAEKDQSLALAEAQRLITYYMDAVHHRRVAPGGPEVDDLDRAVTKHLDWAEHLARLAQPPAAIPHVISIGHRQRDLAFLLGHAGRLDRAAQTFASAARTFDTAARLEPGNAAHWYVAADSHREAGLVHLRHKKFEDAEREFRRAIEAHERVFAKFPDYRPAFPWATAHLELARLLIRTGRMRDVEPLVARGVELRRERGGAPDPLAARVWLAHLLREEGEVDRAAATYAAVIAAQPGNAEAWSGRGHAHAAKGEFAEAVDAFSAAIRLKHDDADTRTGRAWSHFHRHQWDMAVADYSRAIELAPDVHTNWYHRGLAHLERAAWHAALADFSRIVALWPHEPRGWYLRAVAYAQLSEPDDAVADLRQAVARGYRDVAELTAESRLDPLRAREPFKKLVEDLKKQTATPSSTRAGT